MSLDKPPQPDLPAPLSKPSAWQNEQDSQLLKFVGRYKVGFGIIASFLWFLSFSLGMLIPSLPHRIALGWDQKITTQDAEIGQLTKILLAKAPLASDKDGKEGKLSPESHDVLTALRTASDKIDDPGKSTKPVEFNWCNRWQLASHFLWATVLFTPLNVAILAVLADFIGGCSSSKADIEQVTDDIEVARHNGDELLKRNLVQRKRYLEEHPVHSAMRSLVVYLVFISGLYIATSSPFESTDGPQNQTQYIRLAGLISLLGFMVGYDPTRFTAWLALIPSPTPPKPPPPGPPGAQHLEGTIKADLTPVNPGVPTPEIPKPEES
jgi:hypothetical protein